MLDSVIVFTGPAFADKSEGVRWGGARVGRCGGGKAVWVVFWASFSVGKNESGAPTRLVQKLRAGSKIEPEIRTSQ